MEEEKKVEPQVTESTPVVASAEEVKAEEVVAPAEEEVKTE